ncbi:nitroreductase family protein [Williamsia sterculiae]|nr:nitroreductase family protein [Williamsia sterculiae]
MTSECPEFAATRGLHPVLSDRFSPLDFDAGSEVSDAEVDTLLDAARSAPSAGNSQPWSFVVARRDDAVHRRVLPYLASSSAGWAGRAGLLVVHLCHLFVEDTPDWPYSEFSHYDVGQAAAYMTVQALALGLSVRQFRAFDRDGLAREFDVPDHWEVATMSAYGIAGHGIGESLPGSRSRRSRADITWARAGVATTRE